MISKKCLPKMIVVILIIAAVLRLWKLGSIPPHLTPDEAALGYNAYSILKTGRDEYGELLPIIFKFFPALMSSTDWYGPSGDTKKYTGWRPTLMM